MSHFKKVIKTGKITLEVDELKIFRISCLPHFCCYFSSASWWCGATGIWSKSSFHYVPLNMMYVLESWSHLPSQAARHQPQWEPRGYRSFGQEIERNAISAEHNFISLVLCTIFTNFDFVRLQMVRFSPVVLLVYVMLMFLCYYKHQICRSIEDIHYSGTGSHQSRKKVRKILCISGPIGPFYTHFTHF